MYIEPHTLYVDSMDPKQTHFHSLHLMRLFLSTLHVSDILSLIYLSKNKLFVESFRLFTWVYIPLVYKCLIKYFVNPINICDQSPLRTYNCSPSDIIMTSAWATTLELCMWIMFCGLPNNCSKHY